MAQRLHVSDAKNRRLYHLLHSGGTSSCSGRISFTKPAPGELLQLDEATRHAEVQHQADGQGARCQCESHKAFMPRSPSCEAPRRERIVTKIVDLRLSGSTASMEPATNSRWAGTTIGTAEPTNSGMAASRRTKFKRLSPRCLRGSRHSRRSRTRRATRRLQQDRACFIGTVAAPCHDLIRPHQHERRFVRAPATPATHDERHGGPASMLRRRHEGARIRRPRAESQQGPFEAQAVEQRASVVQPGMRGPPAGTGTWRVVVGNIGWRRAAVRDDDRRRIVAGAERHAWNVELPFGVGVQVCCRIRTFRSRRQGPRPRAATWPGTTPPNRRTAWA